MADLTITPANVGIVEKAAVTRTVQVAEAVTAGAALYVVAASGKYGLADVTTSAKQTVAAIALTGGGTDEYIVALFPTSKVDIGATVAVGTIYVLSAAGAISPAADLTTGDYVSIIGVAITASQINFKPDNTGIQVP